MHYSFTNRENHPLISLIRYQFDMENLIIRTVTEADTLRCFEIETRCFEPSEAATLEKIRKRARIYPEGFIVAELHGEVVSLINSGATDQLNLADEDFKDMTGHHPDGKNVAIFAVATAPEVQGKGIGAKLMSDFIKRMKISGKESILLICKNNLITFYKKFGFKTLGKSNSTHGGFEWWEMELVIK